MKRTRAQVWLTLVVAALLTATLQAVAARAGTDDQRIAWQMQCSPERCALWGRAPHYLDAKNEKHVVMFFCTCREQGGKAFVIFQHPLFRSLIREEKEVALLLDPGESAAVTWQGNPSETPMRLTRDVVEGRVEVPLDFLLDFVKAERLLVAIDGRKITLDLPGVGRPMWETVNEACRRGIDATQRSVATVFR